MARSADYYFLLFGRILVGGYFVWTGILYGLNFAHTSAEFAALKVGSAQPAWIAAAVILIVVLGGLAIVFDWKMRYAALVLAAYLIASIALAHPALTSAAAADGLVKDIALVGALLYMSATAD